MSEAAAAWLKRQLRALWKPSYGDHDERVGRFVVTYGLADLGKDALPPTPVPIDDLRLMTLSYRWGIGIRGEPRPRAPLVIYRPVADSTGTGRIRFEPIGAWDAACSRLALQTPRIARLALRMHRAAEDASASDWASELVLPSFYFAFGTTDEPSPPTGIDSIHWSSRAC